MTEEGVCGKKGGSRYVVVDGIRYHVHKDFSNGGRGEAITVGGINYNVSSTRGSETVFIPDSVSKKLPK